MAFFSLSQIKIRKMVACKEKNAKLVAKLKSNPQRLLVTVLVGNNFVNIAAASLATVIAIEFFNSSIVGITTGIMTLIILVFGEITPKSISIRHNEKIARLSAKPLFIIEQIFSPLTWLFEKLYPKGSLRTPIITEEELRIMASLGVEEGTVQAREVEIIKKVFQLNDITVEDAMTPRSKIYALKENSKLKNVKNKIISGFSRIPIYENNIDHITGILYKNDALVYLAKKDIDITLKEIARGAIFIPGSKLIDELMREFQSKHIHMGVVVNEYGETVGIITLEDILEELVGEILDETDVSEELIKRVDKNTILAHGETEVKHINKFFNTVLDEKYNTVSGLIEKKLGRIPKIGQRLKLEGVTLEVIDADKKTIKKVSIVKK